MATRRCGISSFGDASFDVVVSQFALMYFPERVRSLSEMWRTLASGGRLAIAAWAPLRRARGYQILVNMPPDSAEVRPQTCSQRLSRQHKTPYAGVWSRQRHGVRARPRLGTSLRMIERHCGALIDGAHARIVARLDALEAAAEREVEAPRASERRSARVRPAPLLDGKRARWRKPRRGAVLRARSYAAVGGPNQVVSASASPSWVWSPTQATYPSGRINKAVGAMTAPSAGSSHVPAYLASIS